MPNDPNVKVLRNSCAVAAIEVSKLAKWQRLPGADALEFFVAVPDDRLVSVLIFRLLLSFRLTSLLQTYRAVCHSVLFIPLFQTFMASFDHTIRSNY